MLHFENDYNKGAHPQVLEALLRTNHQAQSGYGMDSYTLEAIGLIKELCQCPKAEVFFLTGGTQTNQLIIDTMLAPYEGVIAAETGHINTHEAGAIEYTGHKVLMLPHHQGKLSAKDVEIYLEDFESDANHSHMVYPGMVYISHPTEYGTLYSQEELEELSRVCKKHQIPLFLDGARLVYGLAVEGAMDLPTIASLTDVFYLGGTKAGLLCGEAVVFTKENCPKHFVTSVKQHGALLAKGRLLGVQFQTLLTDHLYKEIGCHALEMAKQVKDILKEKNYRFFLESPTNQQFILVSNQKLQQLSDVLAYSFWEKYDDHHTVIRLATSWSTSPEEVQSLREIL